MLQVQLSLKEASRWVAAGHIVAREEFILHEGQKHLAQVPAEGSLKVYLEEGRYLCARNQAVSVRFDKARGTLLSLCLDGQ